MGQNISNNLLQAHNGDLEIRRHFGSQNIDDATTLTKAEMATALIKADSTEAEFVTYIEGKSAWFANLSSTLQSKFHEQAKLWVDVVREMDNQGFVP